LIISWCSARTSNDLEGIVAKTLADFVWAANQVVQGAQLSYSQKVRRAELFERPTNGQIIDAQRATCDRGRPTAVVYPNFVETDFFEYPCTQLLP
jgi:hypothetical protein